MMLTSCIRASHPFGNHVIRQLSTDAPS